jgi:hypothetical protein
MAEKRFVSKSFGDIKTLEVILDSAGALHTSVMLASCAPAEYRGKASTWLWKFV